MATIPIRKVNPAGTISGNQFRVIVYPLETAAVIQGGDLVSDEDTNGLAAKATSPAVATKKLLGFALHDTKEGTPWLLGAGQTGGDFGGTFGGTFMGSNNLLRSIEGVGVHILAADPDNIFEINLSGTFSLSQIGAQVGLVEDASGFWKADAGQVNKVAVVVGYPRGPNDGVPGDTNARVFIRFLSSVYLLN